MRNRYFNALRMFLGGALCLGITTTQGQTVNTFPYLEDFEGSSSTQNFPAGWSTNTSSFRWEIEDNMSGSNQSSSSTGAAWDHTQYTTNNTGDYAFTEASSGGTGATTNLNSPTIDLTGQYGIITLDFWYHMYGSAMGTFSVDILNSSNQVIQANAWSISGQQHTSGTAPWTQATVNLSQYYNQQIKLRFVGTRGTSFTSDMCLDDVGITITPLADPTGVTASSTSVCASGTVTLTAQGIANTAEWYDDVCHGNVIGTGNSINVTVLGNTTYYVANTDQNLGAVSANCSSVSITTQVLGLVNTGTITDNPCHSAAVNYAASGSVAVASTLTGNGVGQSPFTYDWPSGNTAGPGTSTTENGLAAGDYVLTTTDANGCVQLDTFTVAQPNPVLTSSTQTPVICNGQSNGDATLNFAGGGVPSYNYTWPSGNTGTATATGTTTESGLAAGMYIITVTDANNCEYQPAITVTEPNAVTASSAITDALCDEANIGTYGTVNQTVTGGVLPYNYAWSNGDSVQDLNQIPAGVYQLTVTDANGCVLVATPDTVTAPAPIVTVIDSLMDLVACNGDSTGFVALHATGGSILPTAYDSVINAGSAVITTTAANTPFGSEFEDNKNQIIYTAAELQAAGFVAGEIRQIGFEVVSAAPDTLHDFSIAVAHTSAQAVVNSPDLYQWQTTGFTTIHTSDHVASNGWNQFACSGFYWDGTSNILIQTCFNNDTIINAVSSPVTATVTAYNSNIHGESMSWYGDPCSNEGYNGLTDVRPILDIEIWENPYEYNYIWSNAQKDTVEADMGAGDYIVTISDINNCQLVDTITINEPTPVMTAPAATDALCNGDANGSMDATATGGTGPYTYAWSNSATGPVNSNLAAGMYYVTVTDDNGCMTADSGMIAEPALLVSTITESEGVRCEGDETGSAAVAATGGTPTYTYTWSDGQSTQLASNLSDGSYDVTISDANGCTSVENVNISAEFQVNAVNLGPDYSVGYGALDTLDAPFVYLNYLWNDNPLYINPSLAWYATNDTTFYVEVVDGNGCTSTDTINVSVALSVQDLNNNVAVRYYPNPTSGMVNFEFDGMNGEQVAVEVLNVQGQVITQKTIGNAVSGTQYQVDLTGQSAGVYFIRLNAAGRTAVNKVTLK